MGALPARKITINYKKVVKNNMIQFKAERRETGLDLGFFKSFDDMQEYCERLYKRPMFKFELIFLEEN